MRTLFMLLFGFCFVFFGTETAYSYWENQQDIIKLQNSGDNETVIISELALQSEGARLIPEGALRGKDDVTEIVYVYQVEIQPGHTLEVHPEAVAIIKDGIRIPDGDGLVIFRFETDEIDAGHLLVTLHVSLRMPETEAQRTLLQGGKVVFSLAFTQTMQP